MSRAELLILGGALLLLLVDLIFGLAIVEYAFSDVVWTAAALALIVAFVNRRMPSLLPGAYGTLLLGLAVVAVVMGVREIVEDVLFILRPPAGADAAYVLGLVGLIVGVGAMAAGAWQILRGGSTG